MPKLANIRLKALYEITYLTSFLLNRPQGGHVS